LEWSAQTTKYQEKTMKKNLFTCITAIALLATLTFPLQLAAQQEQQSKPLPHYTVTDLGPAIDLSSGVNNKGWVDGIALLPDSSVRAFLWRKGTRTVLSTFGGPNSNAFGAKSF
jgi:hypothetical protein